MRIVNLSSNTTLADRAEVARSFWTRLRGLMGRRELPAGTGLVIEPNNSVHTFWMHFPIDVIFVDREGIVVGLREAMPPNRPFAGAQRAHRTIELPAGTISRTSTKPADRLRFE
jgi:uncharacterized protein